MTSTASNIDTTSDKPADTGYVILARQKASKEIDVTSLGSWELVAKDITARNAGEAVRKYAEKKTDGSKDSLVLVAIATRSWKPASRDAEGHDVARHQRGDMSALIVERLPKHDSQDVAPRQGHFSHPTNPARTWFGKAVTPKPIGQVSTANRMATCVVCVDLWETFGTLGWIAGRS